ncbi:MAG: recombinase family protein [Lachnospiraceae bacterium]|nr:recombinase family protein [Lachnospiraceae bacterium]
MLAAIYCRLSKEDSGREEGANSESIVNQRKLLSDYAVKHDFDIYDYYIDEDRSGLDRERPDFLRLIEDARLGRFEVVLCKTQSRFTRDMEMVEKYIHGLFPLWGIRFISVVETYDTAIKGNKKARQISGLVNEWYCEDLSDNIKAVLHKKMRDGEFIGSFACYGYVKSADRHGLEIEEETAEVVRKIYRMYLDGDSSRVIAAKLTSAKIPTPTAWKQMKGLKYKNPAAAKKEYIIDKQIENGATDNELQIDKRFTWSNNTIKKILSNETYIGTLVQGKEQKVSFKSKRIRTVPKEAWIRVENHHPAIIDYETFEKVRGLRKSRMR